MRKYHITLLFYHVKKRKFLLIFLTIFSILCFNEFRKFGSVELSPPGVVLDTLGGLGNQLFRYACAYSLSRKLGVPLYMEIPKEVLEPGADEFYSTMTRPFVMSKFNIKYDKGYPAWYRWHINIATWLWSVSSFSFYPMMRVDDVDIWEYYEGKLTLPFKDKLIYIQDYCQAEELFKDYKEDLMDMLQLKMTPEELSRPSIKSWISLIEESGEGSVALHVRRGDYAMGCRKDSIWFTPISFYQEAMLKVIDKVKGEDEDRRVDFFVFSDQMEIVKDELLKGLELPQNVQVHFVSCHGCSTIFEDFYLMLICKHIITSNSTFSWWAAYLNRNPNKTVISPMFHPSTFVEYKDERMRKFKAMEATIFYPKEWIVINPFKDMGINSSSGGVSISRCL